MKFQPHMAGALVCLIIAGCHSSASQFGMNRNAAAQDGEDEEIASTPPKQTPAAPTDEPKAPQNSANVLLQEGQLALRSGDLTQAEQRFQQVVTVDPMNAVAHHRLAVIADQRQDYISAEQHYLVAYQANPTDANLLSDMGYSYMLQGNTGHAKRFLNDALAKNPQHTQAANNLGAIYAQEGDAEKALAMFRRSGSEQEAQAKLAYVMNQKASSTFASAKAESPLPAKRGFDDSALPAGVSDEHRHIVEQMRAAREVAERERQAELQQFPRRDGSPSEGQAVALAEYPGREFYPEANSQAFESAPAEYETADALPPAYRTGGERDRAEFEDVDAYRSDREVYGASATDGFGIRITPNDGQRDSAEADSLDPAAAWPPEHDGRAANALPRGVDAGRAQEVVHAGGRLPARDTADQVSYADEAYADAGERGLPQFDNYLEPVDDESPSASFVNPSPANPRRFESQTVQTDRGQSPAKAAMLAGLNAGPSQLFPVSSGLTPSSANDAEFPATETRLGADFSQPSRALPGADDIRNWSAERGNTYEAHRHVAPAAPNTRMGYDFDPPARTTSARYESFHEDALNQSSPTAWEEPSPSARALQEHSQFNRR